MENDGLKDLFSKSLSDYEDFEDKGEWGDIEEKLLRRNFLIFQPHRFNIYYATCIGVTFFLALGISGHYIFNYVLGYSEVQEVQVSAIQKSTILNSSSQKAAIPNEKARAEGRVQRELDTIREMKPLKTPEEKSVKSNITATNKNNSSSESLSGAKDKLVKGKVKPAISQLNSSASEEDPERVNEQQIALEKPVEPDSIGNIQKDPVVIRKKVVLIKQDTLFKFDTVRVKQSK